MNLCESDMVILIHESMRILDGVFTSLRAIHIHDHCESDMDAEGLRQRFLEYCRVGKILTNPERDELAKLATMFVPYGRRDDILPALMLATPRTSAQSVGGVGLVGALQCSKLS